MSTLQKERQKKKKRTKKAVDSKGENDVALDFSDQTIPSKCDELDNDYISSSKFQLLTIEDDESVELSSRTKHDKTSTYDVLQSQDHFPSVNVHPSVPMSEVVSDLQEVLLYPNLCDFHVSQTVKRTDSISFCCAPRKRVTPFTNQQLKNIYDCTDIEVARDFENQFLSNSLEEHFNNDPLFMLLNEYLQFRTKVDVNLMDMAKLKDQISIIEPTIWVMQQKTKEFRGTCGDNLTAVGSAKYEVACIDKRRLETMASLKIQLRDLACTTYTSNLIAADISKLRIEQVVREIMDNPIFGKENSHVYLSLENDVEEDNILCIEHLKAAISIFFCFLRRPCYDKVFVNDIRTWLIKLVGVLLTVATLKDHWFLLFHLLRCPSGVAVWGSHIVQVPLRSAPHGNFGSCEIDHCITLLSILLTQIEKRNEFLRARTESHREISETVKDGLWILVDSDGEEGITTTGECIGLKETDLIALLNQIPFKLLFCAVLNIEKKGESYIIYSERITPSQLINLFAFNTTLIELLGKGLIAYSSERYKQFSKHLVRLIKHCLQYVCDSYELLIKNNLERDSDVCQRIEAEFGAFVLKSCRYIYKTRNFGNWQFFTSLPFANLHVTKLWELFYYLNVGFPDDFSEKDEDFELLCNSTMFLDSFNTVIVDTCLDDLYYLLQTFYEMALAKDRTTNWRFMKYICYHVFTIGFINASTKDICYKISRDMLTNMTIIHPDLISHILKIAKERLIEIDNFIYLLKWLPLRKWIPDDISFEIISLWLMHYTYETTESTLARFIISHLNWEFEVTHVLFLPHHIHIRVACLICEAASKYVHEVIALSGISESVRKVSKFMDTAKEEFLAWCWSMISTLHLHYMDQNRDAINMLLTNTGDILKTIPELEKIKSVSQGVAENEPLSIYLSILISLCGHSIPLICQRGFVQMQKLLEDHRHTIVIKCLYLITPLFINCSEVLRSCDNFQQLMKLLFNSDRTYMRIAKDLLVVNSPGPILEILVNMLQAQIINFTNYGLSSPTLLINLWLECLTCLPNWQNPNVLYTIDMILKIAHQFSESWWKAKEYFRFYYSSCGDLPKSKWAFLLRSNTNTKFPSPSADYAWFALLSLEVEHELNELGTNFWPVLLRQLYQGQKSSLANILKKTIAVVEGSTYYPSTLVLFKYANIISDITVTHPLLPIMAQKFFTLFLSRVKFQAEEESSYGVADKFFECNTSLMNNVKLKFQQAEEYYSNKAHSLSGKNDDALFFYCSLSKIYKAYILWLQESSINTISINQNIELPPQFVTEKLTLIINGNEQHWTEYVDLPRIRAEQNECIIRWLKSSFRYFLAKKPACDSLLIKQECTPVDRIINRLKSYDKPKDPPILIIEDKIIKKISIVDININTLNVLKANISIVDKYSQKIHCIGHELNALNGNYKDNLVSLYTNITYQEIQLARCSSIFSKSVLSCAKPAEVVVELEMSQKDNNVCRKIEDNRGRHEELIQLLMSQDLNPLIIAIEELKQTADYLVLKNLKDPHIAKFAIEFFYELIHNLNVNLCFTNEIFISLLSVLGVYIEAHQEQQGMRIMEIAFKRPELANICVEFFIPSKTGPDNFIKMYKFLIDYHVQQYDTRTIFVLISKFDLRNWLQSFHPKLADINRLLKLILIGLETWSYSDTNILQGLFRRHLVQIFDHEFPENYGEVLQAVLKLASEQKINPNVIMDLINSLLIRSNCEPIHMNTTQSAVLEQIKQFSTHQNLFTFKSITDTIDLLARHFHSDRLQHGLHGLYPGHNNVCQQLSILFACFGHAATISAIYSYPCESADQISDWIFGSIAGMYSPWLLIYTGQNVENHTANWIQQFIADGKVLYPWSEVHGDNANIMIQSFVTCLQYILDTLPVTSILSHVLSWYSFHFAKRHTPEHIRTSIQSALAQLPWSQFYPQAVNLESLQNILKEQLPDCDSFVGFIFLQVPWTSWFSEKYYFWDSTTQKQSICFLFTIFIQISFETNVHGDTRTKNILEEALSYPWTDIDYQGIENAFNWIIIGVEPTIILKQPSEINSVDSAVLNLLKYATGMTVKSINRTNFSTEQAKRITYVKYVVLLLTYSGSKYENLFQLVEAKKAFTDAVYELISDIESVVSADSENSTNKDFEACNLIIEILRPLHAQSDNISRLMVDALISYQSTCSVGNYIIPNSLNAIGLCKSFPYSMYLLLEATIFNYFECQGNALNQSSSTWTSVLQRLGIMLDCMNLQILIQGPFLLTLHIFIIYKLDSIFAMEEKIIFLQDISQLLENVKLNNRTESRITIIWGLIISAGSIILQKTENAKKPLLVLARYLQTTSRQSDGWGEGLLEAIGLKRDNITNRNKLLGRCLTCLIFSLVFGESTSDSKSNDELATAKEELRTISCSKKYSDIKVASNKAIEILDNYLSCDANMIANNVSKLINLFYNDKFLISVCDIWKLINI